MKNLFLTTITFLIVLSAPCLLNAQNETIDNSIQKRTQELNQFYDILSKTVKKGDFEGYSNLYHQDAVVVFTAGEDKKSVPVIQALNKWKSGFEDTKSGKVKAQVEFRFSQRVGDETTAHETGIFHYQSYNKAGEVISNYYGHLDMLLVKLDNQWKMIMEHQISDATPEEWDALSPEY
ncbi:Ketosteroid isomerase homolog [Zhouia amylolytica]|uniref:Ketosteroid isomerase homolog n=1 Tax=Zhouia amylolytica TaxID=376730 RepID=A0A1I6TFV5_9FLAO|nr:hypothetical protein [Zhouia amylolytica]MCQ0112157.1 hypothetical protein [Zhouia amylolytica]SFS88089.1 Ketosteroid isomerase homolog [Zhouia amylolytica]